MTEFLGSMHHKRPREETEDRLFILARPFILAEYGREQNEKGIPIDILAE